MKMGSGLLHTVLSCVVLLICTSVSVDADEFPTSPQQKEAKNLLEKAKALDAKGEYNQAEKLYRTIMKDYWDVKIPGQEMASYYSEAAYRRILDYRCMERNGDNHKPVKTKEALVKQLTDAFKKHDKTAMEKLMACPVRVGKDSSDQLFYLMPEQVASVLSEWSAKVALDWSMQNFGTGKIIIRNELYPWDDVLRLGYKENKDGWQWNGFFYGELFENSESIKLRRSLSAE